MLTYALPYGDVISGRRIPKKTKVGIFWYGTLRSKENCGLDANVFRLERWLEADVESLERVERTNKLIFSPGRWRCLGKGLALVLKKGFC